VGDSVGGASRDSAERNRVGAAARRVEVSIPEGTHSWSVVALFGPHEHGDFDHPTPVSFDVR
jgi:hypothetical protein